MPAIKKQHIIVNLFTFNPEMVKLIVYCYIVSLISLHEEGRLERRWKESMESQRRTMIVTVSADGETEMPSGFWDCLDILHRWCMEESHLDGQSLVFQMTAMHLKTYIPHIYSFLSQNGDLHRNYQRGHTQR